MSRKTILPSAELTRELLPALRMMVRFPTRSEKVASFNTGLDFERLLAWTKAHGRPTAETLGAVMREQGGFEREPEIRAKGAPMGPRVTSGKLTLEQASTPANIPQLPSRPLGGLAAPAPAREIRAVVPPAVKAAAAASVVMPAPNPSEAVSAAPAVHGRAWLSVRAMNATLKTYLPAVELWIANPAMMQSDVCARCGLTRGAFAQYKQAHFGTFRGRPSTELLREWVQWARNRLGYDSAPNKCDGARPPASTEQTTPALPRPPACLAELAGKERRHLVASVVCGLLAQGNPDFMPTAELVCRGVEICEEIVRQDAQLKVRGGAS